jgi:hypothetical protein
MLPKMPQTKNIQRITCPSLHLSQAGMTGGIPDNAPPSEKCCMGFQVIYLLIGTMPSLVFLSEKVDDVEGFKHLHPLYSLVIGCSFKLWRIHPMRNIILII